MNPIRNWLFSLGSASFNVFIALIFFLITARITSPAFFGEVAIIQLLEVISASILYFVPGQIVTREIAYAYAQKTLDKKMVDDFLTIPFLSLPFLLVLLFFPADYVKLAIPYLFLYIANAVENSEMIGMDMFKESAISGFLFLTIRWGISIIAVLQRDIYLLLALWTVGAIISNSFNLFMISRKLGGAVFPSFNFPFVLSHFRKALPLYLSNVIGFLSLQGDRVTTSYLLGSYYLGLYQFSALVGGVPSMFLGSISGPLLSASSYYKALGKDEKFMSSVTFKFASLLTFLVVIVSIPLARILIPVMFPDYAEAVNVLTILLLVSTLPFPIGTLTTFIVAFKRSLRPFFFITLATASTVLITSYVLIPTMGIMGGAISQLASGLISSAFVLYYSVSTKVFFPSGKEFFLLSLIPLLGFYEYFIDPLWLDVIALLGVVLVFKVFKIIRKDEAKVVSSFLPKWLRFLGFIILGIGA